MSDEERDEKTASSPPPRQKRASAKRKVGGENEEEAPVRRVAAKNKRKRPSPSPPLTALSSSAKTASPPQSVPAIAAPPLVERGLTLTALVHGLRTSAFRRVSFMVGAGISVAAGIPDFRTPKTGLYAQVKALGLPVPEDIFSLDFFLEDPQPFYSLAARFLFHEVRPVRAHIFMKSLHDRGALHMVYTQNIDGLELQAGVPEKKLIQAHGHMRAAHCCNCKREYPIEEFKAYALRHEVWYCQACSGENKRNTVRNVIKPDIVFFGEKLGKKFDNQLAKVHESDLVFVMGTALKVAPFSTLVKQVPESIPLVVINRDLPKQVDRENTLFLPRDIEDAITMLCEQLEWP